MRVREGCLFFNDIKGYLQCRRQILMSYSFLAVSVMLELQCTRITSLEILGTLIAGL